MYGKIFDSIYEGTLYGQWEALVTMQQLIVLCDADGIVDMTPQAIAARTSIPLRIIKKGLAILEAPDPHSRTPDQEGKRIELIDAHRPWGWHLVNHEKYQHMQDADTVRAQTRERVRRHREAKRAVTEGNAQKRHTDTYTNTDTKDKDIVELTLDGAPPEKKNGKVNYRPQALEILSFLNEKAGRTFEPVDSNLERIEARLKEGADYWDIRAVVAKKCREWSGDEKMCEFLRPATLFGREKFWQYQGQLEKVA